MTNYIDKIYFKNNPHPIPLTYTPHPQQTPHNKTKPHKTHRAKAPNPKKHPTINNIPKNSN
jgi:hypothetical protein